MSHLLPRSLCHAETKILFVRSSSLKLKENLWSNLGLLESLRTHVLWNVLSGPVGRKHTLNSNCVALNFIQRHHQV